MLLPFNSSAQNSVIDAVNDDLGIGTSSLLVTPNVHGRTINTDIVHDGNYYVVVTVLDDASVSTSSTPDEIELIITYCYYQGTNLTPNLTVPVNEDRYTIDVSNLVVPSSAFAIPSRLYNPDVVVLFEPTSSTYTAVVTFDTDNPDYGAYWTEFSFDPTISSMGITQLTSNGGALPINSQMINPLYCYNPRVDRAYDPVGSQKFAVVEMHEGSVGIDEPFITYFDFNGVNSVYTTNWANWYMSVLPWPGAVVGTVYYNPDVAMCFNDFTGDFVCASSIMKSTSSTTYQVSGYEVQPGGTLNLAYQTNVLSVMNSNPALADNRARICAPPIYSDGAGIVPFVISSSHSRFSYPPTTPPTVGPFPDGNLLYANYSCTNTTNVFPDQEYYYASSYSGNAALDWVGDNATTNMSNREAVMAWPSSLHPWSAGPDETGIFCIGEPAPLLTNDPYEWFNVNVFPLTPGNPDKYPVAVASCFENGGDYVIAWVHDEEVSIKVRQNHYYDFKLSLVKSIGAEVFPNPVDNEIYIHSASDAPVMLLNSLGIKIRESVSSKDGKLSFHVSDISNGQYFIVIDGKTYPILINHK